LNDSAVTIVPSNRSGRAATGSDGDARDGIDHVARGAFPVVDRRGPALSAIQLDDEAASGSR